MKLTTTVKVQQGTVCGGKGVLPNGSSYFYFKRIPYAIPPLGELRFEAPVPMTRFPSPVIDCTKDGDVSFQLDRITRKGFGSENCLFLNIYVAESAPDKKLPVMVFIHEGGFVRCSSNSDDYIPHYLMQENVVVVTFNYRLGALGFLSLPEANIPGNAGLKDQRLVLRWVQNNISQFNGDPNNVTLFGSSAGSVCVHLHMLSENSRYLFHKAILESGTANASWAIRENPSSKAIKFAQLMGCTSDNPHEVSKFLKNHTNMEEFLTNCIPTLTDEDFRHSFPIAFKPVVEKESADAVITEDPLKSMSKVNSIKIPAIMGYNSGEGILAASNAIKRLEVFDQDLGRFIPWNLNLNPKDPKHVEVAGKIRDLFFHGEKLDEKLLSNLAELLGDFYFNIAIFMMAEIHSRKQHNSPLYFYRFDYVGELDMYKKFYKVGLEGACHADEINYIIQSVLTESLGKDRDKKMSETICKLWANFARYGNPTPKECESFVDCTWEPVPKVGEREDFKLKAFVIDEMQKMIENPNEDRMQFWKSIFEKYKGNWLPIDNNN